MLLSGLVETPRSRLQAARGDPSRPKATTARRARSPTADSWSTGSRSKPHEEELRSRPSDDPGGPGEARGADGQVDVEDPSPVHGVDEYAAEDRPEDRRDHHRDADHCHGAPHPVLPDRPDHHGDPDRANHAGADALHDTEGDEGGGGPCDPAHQRTRREQADRGEPDRAGSVGVDRLSSDWDGGGEGEQVSGHHPLHGRERYLETGRQPVEGDAHDRDVQNGRDHS